MMIGVQMMQPKKNATLKRMVKPPSTVVTVSALPRMASRMGSIMMSMSVGVAS